MTSFPPHPPTLADVPRPGLIPPDEIFPDADYQFRLKLARAEPADFFRPWFPDDILLARRRHVVETAPERCVPCLPEAAPLLRETLDLAGAWGLAPGNRPSPNAAAAAVLRHLATSLEPDLVFLVRTPAGPRLLAGAICFPSSWAPEEKLGRSVLDTHAVVPGLNAQLGAAIDSFLDRLRPGVAWMRANWGLAATPELDQHPARQLPRLVSPCDPARVSVRIEHQALIALPASSGLLFGIRLEIFPVARLLERPRLARNLARALRSMPEPVARYKGLAETRRDLAAFLETAPPR